MKSELFYVHDPMCSWCWGFSGVAHELFNMLPKRVMIHRLLGGLAADDAKLMDVAMQQGIQANWKRIEDEIPGVKFNFDFWEKCLPRRSTYPACRAVIAARSQHEKYDEIMTARIQQAYYQDARNPSDDETLVALASESGMNAGQFREALNNETTKRTLHKEIQLSRRLRVDSFPSLVIMKGESFRHVLINYTDPSPMLTSIELFLEKTDV